MPAQLPLPVCRQVQSLLEGTNLKPAAIAARVGVSRRTIERMRLSLELFSTSYPPAASRIGRPRALTTEQTQWMLDFLDDRPCSYADEIALAVYDEFGVDVADRSIYRYLLQAGWTCKVCKERAAQRSEALRAIWRTRSAHWPADKLVFVDESGANEKTAARKRGWSPKGLSCTVIRTLARSERWSILPALTINGFLPQPLVFQGSVSKEVFQWWLLQRMLPFLSPGSIIVMDNASIYHNLGIEETLADQGVRIEYLPPYSPDFNPIELTFHAIKQWLRTHWGEAASYPDFGAFIRVAVHHAVGPDARSYYRHCGYEVEGVEGVEAVEGVEVV